MKYLSVKQTAEKWKISPAMVRRYCVQGRIPNAFQGETGWKIPEKAKKPIGGKETAVIEAANHPLVRKLVRQKKKKNFHGLYDYVQINLTYSSCRMASCRLTRKQVEMIFMKGKVAEMFEAVKVSDVIEVLNHCVCVDYILDHISEAITVSFLRKLHLLLMKGTVDEAKLRVVAGELRTSQSKRKEKFILPAGQAERTLKELCEIYEKQKQYNLEDILEFHVRFEKIFPFEDGNGRIGRLIAFKECLRHGVMPFILIDKYRSKYLDGLRKWAIDRSVLLQVVTEAQNRFADQISLQDYMEQEHRLNPLSD